MTHPSAEFLDLQAALAGEYSLQRELGRGGMGVVYLARDVQLDRDVAIKVLPTHLARTAAARERFVREARMAAGLSHPHIVPIHRVGEAGGFVFFVMSYVEGETLGERLRTRGPLPPADATRVLREVAWALAYAHGRGIVHRDVKPDNILLEAGTGRALVTDFGIAHGGEDPGPATDPGKIMGTAHFMSPEQAASEPVDGRSDIYSLGVVGYLAVSGRLPFESSNLPAAAGAPGDRSGAERDARRARAASRARRGDRPVPRARSRRPIRRWRGAGGGARPRAGDAARAAADAARVARRAESAARPLPGVVRPVHGADDRRTSSHVLSSATWQRQATARRRAPGRDRLACRCCRSSGSTSTRRAGSSAPDTRSPTCARRSRSRGASAPRPRRYARSDDEADCCTASLRARHVGSATWLAVTFGLLADGSHPREHRFGIVRPCSRRCSARWRWER